MQENRQQTTREEPLEGPRWSRDAPGAIPDKNRPPWEGSVRFSESGDENADGDVSPETADYVATGGNRYRLNAAQRAASFQRPIGEPPGRFLDHAGEVPEARDDYGLGRPGHLAPERNTDRPGRENFQKDEE